MSLLRSKHHPEQRYVGYAAAPSMPELTTSLVAAFGRQREIAVGSFVSSHVFTILGILGISGIIAPIHALTISALDYLIMIDFTVLLLPLLFAGKTLIQIRWKRFDQSKG